MGDQGFMPEPCVEWIQHTQVVEAAAAVGRCRKGSWQGRQCASHTPHKHKLTFQHLIGHPGVITISSTAWTGTCQQAKQVADFNIMSECWCVSEIVPQIIFLDKSPWMHAVLVPASELDANWTSSPSSHLIMSGQQEIKGTSAYVIMPSFLCPPISLRRPI